MTSFLPKISIRHSLTLQVQNSLLTKTFFKYRLLFLQIYLRHVYLPVNSKYGQQGCSNNMWHSGEGCLDKCHHPSHGEGVEDQIIFIELAVFKYLALVKFSGQINQGNLVTFEKRNWQSMAPGRAWGPVKALGRARAHG